MLVKELKDDAIVEVNVNKAYYLMLKQALLFLFSSHTSENKDQQIKEMLTLKYEEMNDFQRSFYTLSLMIAEIEQNAKEKNLFIEKEIESK